MGGNTMPVKASSVVSSGILSIFFCLSIFVVRPSFIVFLLSVIIFDYMFSHVSLGVLRSRTSLIFASDIFLALLFNFVLHSFAVSFLNSAGSHLL